VSVFVWDQKGPALMPCTEKRAGLLLDRGRARGHQVVAFVIRLVDRRAASYVFQPLRIKRDPGSKFTGIALVRETSTAGPMAVVNLFERLHRGRQRAEVLTARRQMRRRRRGNLWYRAPRFLNHGNQQSGWIAPSLQHRVDTTSAWVTRISRWAPISGISMELVRFDMQALENPTIEGAEYPRGTLFGTEIREYHRSKWNHPCADGGATNVPLNLNHITPRAEGGSNRVSNLTVSCVPCNLRQNARERREFVAHDRKRLARILAHAKRPLKDAVAVNSTRWALFNTLKATGLAVEVGTGGRTKWNRTRLRIPKTHALDAVCVGVVDSVLESNRPPLNINATARGSYQRTRLDKYGFSRGYISSSRRSRRAKRLASTPAAWRFARQTVSTSGQPPASFKGSAIGIAG